MRSRLIVLVSGGISSGKSTIGEGLKKDFNFITLSSREALEEMAKKENNGKIPDSRGYLQKYGRKQDKNTKGAWIKNFYQSVILKNQFIVIDSVRIAEQISAFRESYGSTVVHIHVDTPIETRLEWFIKRGRAQDKFSTDEEAKEKFEEYLADPTEAQVPSLKGLADLVIQTEYSANQQDSAIRAASFLRLFPKINTRNVDVVIGGQFGSEGKGQIAAFLAPEYDCLVRVGGPNAGHKVYSEPEPHVFHIIPSGVAKAHDPKIILGPGTVISKERLLKEISDYNLGSDRLVVDPNVTVISKKDIRLEERIDTIGSTKQGVGAATANNILDRLRSSPKHKVTSLKELNQFIGSAHEELEKINRSGKKILLEGTQGTLLSLHHGYYPHVTSRDTTVSGCLAEAGIGPNRVGKVVMVARRYPIRVKNPDTGGTSGEFHSTELSMEEVAKRSGYPIEELKKIEHTSTTNMLRRIAEFNWYLFRKACELNTPTDIAFTFADYITYKNQKARRYDQLSPATTKFIEELERCSGVPVSLIATRFSYRSIIDRRNW